MKGLEGQVGQALFVRVRLHDQIGGQVAEFYGITGENPIVVHPPFTVIVYSSMGRRNAGFRALSMLISEPQHPLCY